VTSVEWLVSGLLIVGAVLTLLAAVGVLRLPDVYTRMSATSKAVTLGVSSILLASALHFHEIGLVDRALAMVAFVFLTAPVAAHMIARAAYLSGVRLWEGTVLDELASASDNEEVGDPDSDPLPPSAP
jgi:multicomponent Na+:H+ antiporter subunit G